MEGTIVGLCAWWGSGLATLLVQDDEGSVHLFHADNGPLVRALRNMLGPEVIGKGHTVNTEALKGVRVRAELDDMGLYLGHLERIEGEET